MSAGDLDGVVRVLCRALMASLLRTHRSKFTQFVLFFACARDSSLKASVTLTNGLARPLGIRRSARPPKGAAPAPRPCGDLAILAEGPRVEIAC